MPWQVQPSEEFPARPVTEPWEKGGAGLDLLVGPSQEELDASPEGILRRNRGFMVRHANT